MTCFLRKTKTERKEDFNKRLTKKVAASITDSIYSSILPYYLVSDGGLLSDEYTFLSYAESIKATVEFFEGLENEELLEEKPEGWEERPRRPRREAADGERRPRREKSE